jgi:hypothetical protein
MKMFWPGGMGEKKRNIFVKANSYKKYTVYLFWKNSYSTGLPPPISV